MHRARDWSVVCAVRTADPVVRRVRCFLPPPCHRSAPARRHRRTPGLHRFLVIYFASAAVAVDSSHMTAPSSASWSWFNQPPNCVNGHVSAVWFMVCRWPQSREGDWVRPHLCKLAWHGPWPVPKRLIRDHVWRDIETWLSDSTVGNNSVVDRRSRRPVLSPLRNNKQQQLNNNNLPQWWQRQPASLLPPLTARRIFPIFYNLWWAGRCPPTKKNCPLSGGDSGRKFRDIVVAYLATSLVNTNEYLGTGRIATDWLFMGDYLMWHCAVLKSAAAVVIPLVLYVLWFSVDRKPPKLPLTAGEEFEPHLIIIWFFGRTASPF